VKKLSSVLLLATLSLLAEPVLVPVSAQQLAAPNETAPTATLLPPTPNVFRHRQRDCIWA
jgi:hypothetical protein